MKAADTANEAKFHFARKVKPTANPAGAGGRCPKDECGLTVL